MDHSAVRRRVPAEPGFWIIIFGDLAIFSVFFVLFAHYRATEPVLFARSQAMLNRGLGLSNTLLLLTSSWAVAEALDAVREYRGADAVRNVNVGLLCGIGFVVLKGFEYREKILAGIRPSSNDLFMLYYALTGVHLIHVIMGLGALSLFRLRAAKPKAADLPLMEGCAIFWHLVDILWVVLFALFYLHR